jgi:hypothetical protein
MLWFGRRPRRDPFPTGVELVQTLFQERGRTLEPGDESPHPAANRAGAKQLSPLGGCNRHGETSQDHAQSKRSPVLNALT